MAVTVDPDGFGAAMDEILTDVNGQVREGAAKAVKKGLAKAGREWRKNAKKVLNDGYWRHGKWVQSGAYVRSITHKMIRDGGEKPHGEAGSATMPGLPHLLEKGHATLGGGRALPHVHIDPAARVAFEATEKYMQEEIGAALEQ